MRPLSTRKHGGEGEDVGKLSLDKEGERNGMNKDPDSPV